MSENSNIEWTDHTFNGWWGCTKVHAGCKNCYAETRDRQFAQGVPSHWGNNPRRMVLGEWHKPEKWNRDAMKAGKRARVFCSSMCDVFEDYHGPVVDQQGKPVEWSIDGLRRRIFTMIEETPHLEWLLLTKRPENVTKMVPLRWLDNWPDNVMTGTSPCDQKTANECIPHLLAVPGRHFLSCEPLLGRIDLALDAWFDEDAWRGKIERPRDGVAKRTRDLLHWVIVGGESGHGVRECDVFWIDDIRQQCEDAGVPCFVKQLGAKPMLGDVSDPHGWPATNSPVDFDTGAIHLRDKKGGDPSEWPEHLRVRQFPT
jgi:protein gp37